ncbi:hypothetical protein CYV26_00825 [Carnobacterium maltaromaticum]|uniref:DUF4352 domain-containing protein n=1 Tax=Carnobacterium maltaromaticum TaxID=2751 RepID=UPI000C785613|nr:DUF4352 domain-containing protein [Carnobacterium maltaromaticum]PLS37027.1 hypothetical protein CYV33_05685 [Carnobacterium maltaromaticum]PLS37841.1 hypothetical protein CYV30_05680 [Carnobacterium maltaromaticum]PLS39782.1 hypothetical protein CYV31_03665 [Carnobacterium maltaromaticum]PLS44538.1 hypothetical protein CYV28_05680 [Carnobacterium maltaromaticum]PLS46571.1 hypothetical protein CYV27_05675 [Carnobacterium maltaromaticum]
MKKISLSVIIALLFLGGCGALTTETKKDLENQSKTINEFKTKFIQNIKMKLTMIEANQSGLDEKKKIVAISMDFKNEDAQAVGIGGGDFILKENDKKYEVISDANNIGQEIEVGKKSTGMLYFEVPEEAQKAELIYTPGDEVLAKWEIELPKSK